MQDMFEWLKLKGKSFGKLVQMQRKLLIFALQVFENMVGQQQDLAAWKVRGFLHLG